MKIKSFSSQLMHQQQAYGFYKYIQSVVSLIENVLLNDSILAFNRALNDFDYSLKPIRKTILTEELKEEYIRKNRIWRGLKSIVKGRMLDTDTTVADIAGRAFILFRKYGYVPKTTYTNQTAIVDNLISSLYTYLKSAEIKALGIRDLIKKLEHSNNTFKDLYLKRVDYLQYLESGKSWQNRKLVDKAYKNLVEKINAVCLLGISEAPDELEIIIRSINVMIEKEKTVIKRRKKADTN